MGRDTGLGGSRVVVGSSGELRSQRYDERH
jgi:hypothetical protein